MAGRFPASAGQVRTSYASRFAPDAIVAGVAGLVILVVGLIAVVRGGFDNDMEGMWWRLPASRTPPFSA